MEFTTKHYHAASRFQRLQLTLTTGWAVVYLLTVNAATLQACFILLPTQAPEELEINCR